jgi:NADPH:quinone reductase-like Zn-dependent oxidoreductase
VIAAASTDDKLALCRERGAVHIVNYERDDLRDALRDLAPELAARDERELIELLVSGRVTPHISAVHDLDQVAEALAAVAGRRSTGKVLLRAGLTAP